MGTADTTTAVADGAEITVGVIGPAVAGTGEEVATAGVAVAGIAVEVGAEIAGGSTVAVGATSSREGLAEPPHATRNNDNADTAAMK